MRAILAGLAMLCAAPAAAQQGWQVTVEPARAAAVACAGNACLSLGCAKGAPATWEITLPGAVLAGVTALSVTVDGAPAGMIALESGQAPGRATANLRDADAPLIAALQAGVTARLRIDDPAAALDAPLSLAGSRDAIDSALAFCPLRAPEAAAAPPPAGTVSFPNDAFGRTSDNPAAEALAAAAALCADFGGTVAAEPGLIRLRDIDGDGVNDAVIDYGFARCSEAASLFCGSGGCSTEIWLGAADGAWSEIFAGQVQGLRFPQAGQVIFDLHGSACGLAGFEPCAATADIRDGALVIRQ